MKSHTKSKNICQLYKNHRKKCKKLDVDIFLDKKLLEFEIFQLKIISRNNRYNGKLNVYGSNTATVPSQMF